eukprot:TRINITY_DN7487_c0_g1_i2.p2 TRINITY_DN7487_c0_g1~~TRINITY_DN7487_c0_g1_i2.p2  ORF type:complete len:132 (-),score=26.37 TRINITY_DN7487_c0_g1_i2:60-398(-)
MCIRDRARAVNQDSSPSLCMSLLVYQAIQMKTEQPSPKHNFGILEEESAKIPSQADSGKPASSLSNWLIDQHKVSLNWYGESKSMSDVEGLLAKIESQGSGRRQPNLSLIHI